MAPLRAKKAWLVYAGLLTVAVLIGELSNFLRGEPLSWLTATWGYALQRPIGNARYWRRTFWILLAVSALMLLRVALVSATALVIVLGFMAVLVPAYVAAYRYAFRSSHLWQRRPADAAAS